ncbi:aminotransferase [Rhizobium leguminosarum]|uniref:aminotransferase n=1 Tax=Rhizobium leguminosarum TaxID=384 RepID=UPI001C901119|nr:aminotransferase [Rhizobium leguminosarum]MBY2925531.1 aminotransferase [Rhizobium leguminosarum]MBY2936119.1 aminotransferase [Rhizobium leguminosarum]
MHIAPPPKNALANWLNDYPSEEVEGYGHLLLEERSETDPAIAADLIDYFESAHLDARQCFHKLARISLHPDAGDEACDAQYPGSLPLTALKGLFGEVMCGMMAESFEFVGKHEYVIPVFLFRNHEDAGQYIYTLSRDATRTREVLGRKGDDFIAIVVDEDGKVTRFIAGEAKWRGTWTPSALAAVMLGPKIEDPEDETKRIHNGKGVWFEVNRGLPVPLGLEQLHAILDECEPDKFASVIASLDRILARRNPDSIERTDLILLAGGSPPKREARVPLLPWKALPEEYTAGRDLQIVELLFSNGDDLINEIYSGLWAREDALAGV